MKSKKQIERMKVTVKIVAAAVAFACTMPALYAQNRSTVRTVSPKEEKNELSVRAQSLSRYPLDACYISVCGSYKGEKYAFVLS